MHSVKKATKTSKAADVNLWRRMRRRSCRVADEAMKESAFRCSSHHLTTARYNRYRPEQPCIVRYEAISSELLGSGQFIYRFTGGAIPGGMIRNFNP
ncbi:hypothetical protein BHM03_00041252 [Ensete ventricosum]|nr:hypothetical protein BHM03_00041252 [Ensete ventricosum]